MRNWRVKIYVEYLCQIGERKEKGVVEICHKYTGQLIAEEKSIKDVEAKSSEFDVMA